MRLYERKISLLRREQHEKSSFTRSGKVQLLLLITYENEL